MIRLTLVARAITLTTALAAGAARGAPIRVQAEAAPATVTVGDPVTYRAVFRTAPGVTLVPAFGATQFWEWDVASLKALPPRPATGSGATDGEVEQAFEAVLLPWSATATGTPALPFTVRVPGASAHVLTVAPAAVTVRSVLAGAKDAGELRPLKGVIGYRSWWPWILALAALAAAGSGWWWWRRRQRRIAAAAEPAVPAVPPELSAREALDALVRSTLLEEGQVKAFYIMLADILRRYLEGRFGVSALDRTTAELLPALRRLPELRDMFPELRAFLDDCDLVKFAKFVPEAGEISADVARARRLVDDTAAGRPASGARA